MADKLKELLERAQAWPKQAQEELVSAGLEIEEKYVRSGPRSVDEEKAAGERAWGRLERLFARMRTLIASAPELIAMAAVVHGDGR